MNTYEELYKVLTENLYGEIAWINEQMTERNTEIQGMQNSGKPLPARWYLLLGEVSVYEKIEERLEHILGEEK